MASENWYYWKPIFTVLLLWGGSWEAKTVFSVKSAPFQEAIVLAFFLAGRDPLVQHPLIYSIFHHHLVMLPMASPSLGLLLLLPIPLTPLNTQGCCQQEFRFPFSKMHRRPHFFTSVIKQGKVFPLTKSTDYAPVQSLMMPILSWALFYLEVCLRLSVS